MVHVLNSNYNWTEDGQQLLSMYFRGGGGGFKLEEPYEHYLINFSNKIKRINKILWKLAAAAGESNNELSVTLGINSLLVILSSSVARKEFCPE